MINRLVLGKNKFCLRVMLVGLVLFSATSLHAQQEVKSVFVQMPDSVCPFLTAVNRADCIDFLESKMKAKVENRFGRESEMTDLTRDYIRIQMSNQSIWQMKLLAADDSTQVICVVSTACAPVCDSDIHFYTTDWKALPLKDFLPTLPGMNDFLVVPDSVSSDYEYSDALLKADIMLMKADLSRDDNTLTLRFTTPEYMEKEAADKLQPFIRRPIVYTWKEGKFNSSDTAE